MNNPLKKIVEAQKSGKKTGIWSCCILGALFALIAVIAYVGGIAMSGVLQSLADNASWFMGGLSAAGGMMRFVGFAILLKIMLANDMWGFLLAGFAAALVIGNIEAVGSACLLLVAFAGVAIAINDFRVSGIQKQAAEGGFSDGI